MQSITTLISLEEGLRRARVALDATVADAYPNDGKVYCAHLDTHLRRAFTEPERLAPDDDFLPPQPELDFCSRCHEHAIFTSDGEGGLWSDCCNAPPVEVDPT